MKRNNVTLLALFALGISVCGCTKSNTGATGMDATGVSKWTFNGSSYTDSNSVYRSDYNALEASDYDGNFLRIFFSTIGKPTVSGTLTVINYAADFSNAYQCIVQVGNIYDGISYGQQVSIGKAGDKVTLAVSASGLLTASFSGITVQYGTTTKTVTGTIREQ